MNSNDGSESTPSVSSPDSTPSLDGDNNDSLGNAEDNSIHEVVTSTTTHQDNVVPKSNQNSDKTNSSSEDENQLSCKSENGQNETEEKSGYSLLSSDANSSLAPKQLSEIAKDTSKVKLTSGNKDISTKRSSNVELVTQSKKICTQDDRLIAQINKIPTESRENLKNFTVSTDDPVPAMSGEYKIEKGFAFWTGTWGFNESSLSIPGQNSKFAYRSRAAAGTMPLKGPVNGIYDGYFYFKVRGTFPKKIQEKGIQLSFTKVSDSPKVYDVKGTGSNVFGSFELFGQFESQNNVMKVSKLYTS